MDTNDARTVTMLTQRILQLEKDLAALKASALTTSSASSTFALKSEVSDERIRSIVNSMSTP